MTIVHYIPRPDDGQGGVFDFSRLSRLKAGVQSNRTQSDDTQKEIAQQFEALFIQQMLKQARQSGLGGTVLDSAQTRLAQSMGDEQMALQLATPGIGLAQALLEQIRAAGQSGQTPVESQTRSAQPPDLAASRLPGLRSRVGEERVFDAPSISSLLAKLSSLPGVEDIRAAVKGAPGHIHEFVSKMAGAARVAASESGVPARLILSQAALESGWGRREIRGSDGETTFNLFGIKAGGSWQGKVVNILTTEFENGVSRKVVQPFRAYDSYADSFADYARLISSNSRYGRVLEASTAEDAAHQIQAAGYATDPAYAQKLISIMRYFDTGSG